MRQTVSDCRSRCRRWLLVMNSCALKSPIVCLYSYGSVETQNWKFFHYTVERSSLDSSFWDPCGSCKWFNFNLTMCFSRRVAKLTWIYCSVKNLCRWQVLQTNIDCVDSVELALISYKTDTKGKLPWRNRIEISRMLRDSCDKRLPQILY